MMKMISALYKLHLIPQKLKKTIIKDVIPTIDNLISVFLFRGTNFIKTTIDTKNPTIPDMEYVNQKQVKTTKY